MDRIISLLRAIADNIGQGGGGDITRREVEVMVQGAKDYADSIVLDVINSEV